MEKGGIANIENPHESVYSSYASDAEKYHETLSLGN